METWIINLIMINNITDQERTIFKIGILAERKYFPFMMMIWLNGNFRLYFMDPSR